MKFASLYLLTTPAIVLVGTAVAMALPGERAAMLASKALSDPVRFLELDEVFTPVLAMSERFRAAFASGYAAVAAHGPLTAIENVLAQKVL